MPQNLAANAAVARTLQRSVLVPVVLMTLLAGGLIWQIGRLMTAARWVEHTDEVISRLYELQLLHVDMQAGVRGFLLNGDDQFLSPYLDARAKLPQRAAELRSLVADRDDALRALREIDALRAEWVDYAEQRIARRRAEGTPTPAAYGPGNRLMNDVRDRFGRFIGEEMTLREQRNRATQWTARRTVWIGGGATVLAGVLLALLARQRLRWMTSTYEAALSRARELSESLEHRVDDRTRELSVANERLGDANRELEAFSYSISHDLRAPMRHISGFAKLLKLSTASRLDPDDADHVDTILRTSTLAGRMVDDLLSFARVGRTQLRDDPIDVDAIVSACLRDLAPDLANRRIEWTIPALRPTHGDAPLIRLVFQNLISNAVKYTAPRDVAHIELGSRAEENGTTYFVRDDGVGFDMAYAHKLFGVFQRLHRAEEFEGTGIGLANVRRIIVRHGGRTWAEGISGVGATFYVHLPDRPAGDANDTPERQPKVSP